MGLESSSSKPASQQAICCKSKQAGRQASQQASAAAAAAAAAAVAVAVAAAAAIGEVGDIDRVRERWSDGVME